MANEKRCGTCLAVKVVDEFHRDPTCRDGRYPVCKPCRNQKAAAHYTDNKERYQERGRDYYQRNRDVALERQKKRAKDLAVSLAWKARRRTLQRLYGITEAEYEAMWLWQGGVCAICLQPEKARDHRSGKLRELSVDHDHETGVVRGLLCHNCNKALGLLGDGTLLLAAFAYAGGEFDR